jgi:UDP-N-acetylglucosamine acyltransferase
MDDFQPTVPMRGDTPAGGLVLRGRPASVHPSAIVEPGAQLGEDVTIGPFCWVSAGAVIGRGTVLENHVTIMGDVHVGSQNHIFPNAVIGGEPQDVSYRGTRTRVDIGDGNIIREGVTINRATEKEEGVTSIGNGNFLMACSHVAHDCRIGDHCTLANGTLLGGHVRVHSRASLSGAVAVHHWATIVVALRRGGFSGEAIEAVSEAHRLLFRAKVGLEPSREILRSQGMLLPDVLHLLDFLTSQQEGRHGRARERRRAA